MTHDFKSYKEAKALLPQLDTVIYVLNLTEGALKSYSYLMPVAKILFVIKDQKYILETTRTHFRKIKELKGLKK